MYGKADSRSPVRRGMWWGVGLYSSPEWGANPRQGQGGMIKNIPLGKYAQPTKLNFCNGYDSLKSLKVDIGN